MANIEPATLADLQALCKTFSDCGFFGRLSPAQAMVIALAGRDLGFSYSQALRAFHLVKGKPVLSADGMVSAAKASGLCEYFRPIEQTETNATWETRRKGEEPVRYSFSMADAEKADLTQDQIVRREDGTTQKMPSMYKRHPKRMLSARAKAYLARDVYPDVLMGLITDDEAEEISRQPARVVIDAAPAPLPAAPNPRALPAKEPHWSDVISRAQTVDDLLKAWIALKPERENMTADELKGLQDFFAARKADIEGVTDAST